jgi:glycosyltransferase involved in cell wall biosynthesis
MTPPRDGPVLSYGGALDPGPAGVLAGGRVKLRHLAREWPERKDFNTLYLVSSAAPPHAPDLVKWAKQRGARFVWNQNGVAFPAWAGSRSGETNGPMRAVMRLADFVVYQSEFCQVSADRFLGPAPCESEVIFNPVDLAEFAPAPEPPPMDEWRLLTAGTHYQRQRVLGPIEVVARLRESGQRAHLTIAGAMRWANADAEIQSAIARHGVADSVTLVPAFSQAEAVALYRGAHILLHPKYHDPCPTVVIEALACGVPVIGSRSGGMPELVGDDGGRLIEVPLSWDDPAAVDPARMAEAVAVVMQAWPRHSGAARARAERLFDARDWVAKHRRIFEGMAR